MTDDGTPVYVERVPISQIATHSSPSLKDDSIGIGNDTRNPSNYKLSDCSYLI